MDEVIFWSYHSHFSLHYCYVCAPLWVVHHLDVVAGERRHGAERGAPLIPGRVRRNGLPHMNSGWLLCWLTYHSNFVWKWMVKVCFGMGCEQFSNPNDNVILYHVLKCCQYYTSDNQFQSVLPVYKTNVNLPLNYSRNGIRPCLLVLQMECFLFAPRRMCSNKLLYDDWLYYPKDVLYLCCWSW